jgi:hypothetical protein
VGKRSWTSFAKDAAPGVYINPRQLDDSVVQGWVTTRWKRRGWKRDGDWWRLRINSGGKATTQASMNTIAAFHETFVEEGVKETKRTVEDLCLARWGGAP